MNYATTGVSRPGIRNRPLWRAWAPWWVLGTSCAVILGLVDGLTLALPYRDPRQLTEGLAALGLTTAMLSAFSLVQAPVLAATSGAFHHRFRREGEGPDVARFAWILVAAVLAATAASLAARLLMLRTDAFQVRPLAVALVTIGAWVAALGGAGLALGLRKAIVAVWPFDGNPRYALAFVVFAVGGALAAVCRGLLHDYGSLLADVSVVVWFGSFLAVEVMVGGLLLGLPRRLYRWLVRRSSSRWSRMAALVVPTLGLFGGALLLDTAPQSARRLASADTLSGLSVRLLERGSDFDRDGSSALFGGGDCAPLNSEIGPRSRDLPDNGIDENCDGRDATVSTTAWENPDPYYRAVPADVVSDYNVIFVCFDTVRVDHLGFHGHSNDTSPYLDALAAESWVFEDAVAPSATTRLSIGAVFSGRYPSGVDWISRARVDDVAESNVFMAEIFRDGGYQTFGVVDEWLPRFVPTMRQGFAKYEPAYRVGTWRDHGHRAGPFVAAKALSLMVGRDMDEPYFLYLHYEAPHHPYTRHPDLRDFGGRTIDRYDAEIAYADHHLGLLMDTFEVEGWLENTVIVFFSDHGEEFHEHGNDFHSRALYEESLRVPLLVHVPGQTPGRFAGRVSLIDILPTLLDLTGQSDDDLRLHGRSLLHRTLGEEGGREGDEEGGDRPILAELEVGVGRPDDLAALYQEDHKLIWNVSTGEMELFDLAKDPGEEEAVDDDGLRASMHERLNTMLESIGNE